MSVREHRERAPGMAGIAIVTVSDTRTRETDQSGAFIRACCEAAGHRITDYRILPDEPERISALLGDLIGRKDTDAVILSGGTGISGRDRTYEAICSVIERRLDGFGELFRMLSFQQIGPAAMLSRAVGGVAGGRVVFSLPGSESAVRLAMEQLILPELGHILGELGRKLEEAEGSKGPTEPRGPRGRKADAGGGQE